MIILASASPRRKEILSELGVDFRVVVADTDESSDISDPVELTRELARRKGLAVYEKLLQSGEYDAESAIIISADTVVCRDGEILGKPRDRADAVAMLTSLSGRSHTVVSGVAVTVRGVTRTDASVTTVRVQEIPREEIERYVDSGEPMDKAGAYGIQGKGCVLVDIGGKNKDNGIVLAAHADTLGAMVSEIKGNGNLKVTPIGGMNANNAEAENCRIVTRFDGVYEGTFQLNNASIHVNGEYDDTKRKYDDMEVVLDEVVSSKEDTEKLGIMAGDIVCFDPRTTVTEKGYIKSRFLDDKLSVGILLLPDSKSLST